MWMLLAISQSSTSHILNDLQLNKVLRALWECQRALWECQVNVVNMSHLPHSPTGAVAATHSGCRFLGAKEFGMCKQGITQGLTMQFHVRHSHSAEAMSHEPQPSTFSLDHDGSVMETSSTTMGVPRGWFDHRGHLFWIFLDYAW